MFGRKKVPDELPSLAVDEINNLHQQRSSGFVQQLPKLNLPPLPTNPRTTQMQRQQPVVQTQPVAQVENKVSVLSDDAENGYFKELVKSVTEDIESVEKLDSWYHNKFLPGDVVFQMREYWEKQQPDLMFKNISGELKTKLLGKTEKLHALEKEWQEIYFKILAKEEEIRKEEKELKESLSEFVSTYKRVKGDK